LKYSDEKRDGSGFLDWKPFHHPQLGDVEIGGFVPGFKVRPPDDELPRLIDEQSRFAVELLNRLPKLETLAPTVERLGPGLWRITVRTVNNGSLPTMAAIGVKARRADPTIVSIDLPLKALVAGEKLQRTWTIPGAGGFAESVWTVTAPDGSTVGVDVNSPLTGTRRISIPLRAQPESKENKL
jgi:hypothetical protein